MDAVFTLQWPEFVVAQHLQELLPSKDGYSILIPLSRQEKGFDLAVLHRGISGQPKALAIQIKASRTYLSQQPKRADTLRYKYYTWFNRFDVSNRADFFVLIGMYAPDLSRTQPVSSGWYSDCSLLFSREEMLNIVNNCRTVGGKPDRMFGFGFNDLSSIILTRGDMNRSGHDYVEFLLEHKIKEIKQLLRN